MAVLGKNLDGGAPTITEDEQPAGEGISLELLLAHPGQTIDTLGQWEALNVFMTDGAVAIDNNVSEREMKRIVLNRKNSLFVGNPRGGRSAAILASLTVNLSSWPASDLDARLPDRWKQAHAARCAALGIPTPPTM